MPASSSAERLSKKSFERLNEGDQKIVRQVMRDVFLRLDEHSRRDNLSALDALRANGVQLIELSSAEKQRWQEIAARAVEQSLSKTIWQRVLQHLTAFRSQANANNQ